MFDTEIRVHGADPEFLAERIGEIATAMINQRYLGAFLDPLNKLAKQADPQFPRTQGTGLREEVMDVNREWVALAARCAAELALLIAMARPDEDEPADEPELPPAA